MNERVIALGFFDGVHLGHGALLRKAREQADRLGCPAAALTFEPHPDERIRGVKTPLINGLEDRRRVMTGQYGMDEMLVLQFDDSLMHMPWQSFVEDVLIGRYHAAHVICGHDYAFGYRGQGNPQLLQAFCRSRGIGCDVIAKVELLGDVVSSTRIRALLQQGDMETANALLGHRHFFTGAVVHGKKLGRLLGYPTANMTLPDGVQPPAYGVYATQVVLWDGSRHPAVTNVGRRPTVDQDEEIRVESWLMDYEGDLYGRELQVEFCKFLRPEQKFENLDQLVAAIRKDGETAGAFFGNRTQA